MLPPSIPDRYLSLWPRDEYEWFWDAYFQLEQFSSGRFIIEPFSVVCAVEQHRRYWRPKDVNVVLLAESHVFTQMGELKRIHWLGGHNPAVGLGCLPSTMPDEFVRLVYCLAYGENDLLLDSSRIAKNAGTPQYWKLLYACIHPTGDAGAFAPILKTKTSPWERLSNKAQLLSRLQEKGIWLVDASIVGLYNPWAKKMDPSTAGTVLRYCWRWYVSKLLYKLAPKHVIVVGKSVSNALEFQGAPFLAQLGCEVTVIPQPNAHLAKGIMEYQHRLVHSICCSNCA